MSRLRNPWPEGYTINTRSPYGWRIHPITRQRKFHHGVDVAGSFPVSAAADGKVMKVGWSPSGGGHTVLIDHGDIVTVYYHGKTKTALKVGQQVKAGDFIYTSGTTGASTGNHLHFEVRRAGGKWGDTMNPEDFLPKPGEKPQEAVSAPEPAPEPVIPAEPVKLAEAVTAPKRSRIPMSEGLRKWFEMKREMKGVKRDG